ncbi:hypothetical protein AAVH_39800, partial [Aphelenchoides avenae]
MQTHTYRRMKNKESRALGTKPASVRSKKGGTPLPKQSRVIRSSGFTTEPYG